MSEQKKTTQDLELFIEENSPLPIYLRVKQLITTKINKGIWIANQKIPSESELVKQLGCSRMTINRALRELTAEGVLVRVQGVGSFVAEEQGQTSLFQIHNIADEIAARNHVHRAEVLILENIKANSIQSLQMQVQEGQPLFHSILVHYENDIPVQVEDRLVNSFLVPDYLKQDFTQVTPNAYLMANAPITEGEHIVKAVLASTQESKWLKINKTEPCLFIQRRTWSNKNLISSARLIYPGSRYHLEGKFTP
ncbi:histidine utilization repressor [Acinetobacter sp. R933-2]|uniref:histidine utilization repressor n=1 Tax=Acinetobacter TaxID=469 RepID=UPI0025762B6C|nr:MULTISPECIES: histidine utilization repressor [Acinetobacter]MDM1248757.1 histidine utilization repressor [Acinetobacter sp. R933-2]MDQ9022072.1 histidine utilization repressor [Acinetobacter sichuanensis]